MKRNIAVVGAGTVGLSTAVRAIEEFGDQISVTVIAEKFYQQTTSYGSGGLWEPYQIAGTPDSLVNKWGQTSFKHFEKLYHSPAGATAGVQLLTVYNLLKSHQDATDPSWSDVVYNFRALETEDLQKMGLPDNFVKGHTFDTYVIDQKYYMKFLTNVLKEQGVKFEQRRIDNIEELTTGSGSFDLVINCSGIGASVVNKDAGMYPIRGQVLRARAPWMKNVWFFGTSYIIPNVDNVVLGGTAQKGDWDTTVRIEDTEKIINNIAKVFPSMKDAHIENAWVGLRPGRSPLRLESECKPGQSPVVHCYGHGGSGITIAMGCAEDVVKKHVSTLLSLKLRGEDLMGNSEILLSSWIKFRSRL